MDKLRLQPVAAGSAADPDERLLSDEELAATDLRGAEGELESATRCGSLFPGHRRDGDVGFPASEYVILTSGF